MYIIRILLAGAFVVSVCLARDSSDSATVTDVDGNTYRTVVIGDQVWMAENLRTTKFNDGSDIPKVTDGVAWSSLSGPGYCFYLTNAKSKSILRYGALYNWYAVNTKKLAPKGWHVPTESDWKKLQNYLFRTGDTWDGRVQGNQIAKALAARTDWRVASNAGAIGNNAAGNNASGFAALPGGYRAVHGAFLYTGDYGTWWSATETSTSSAYYRHLDCDRDDFGWHSNDKKCGMSIRLVRD